MMAAIAKISATPPGPRSGVFGLKTLQALQKDTLSFMHDVSQYGDLAAFDLGPVKAYLLSHPNLIYQILVEEVEKFPRPDNIKRVLGMMIGKGILLTDGSFWLRQRRLVQPAFHHKRIEGYAQTMVNLTQALLDTWRDGEERDISFDMQRITLNIVAKTLFDAQDERFAEQIHTVAQRLQSEVGERLRMPINLDWLPTAKNRQFRTDLALLDKIMREIIAERRKHTDDRGDLMSMLLNAQDEDGSQMTDQQVRDEAITLFLAGHDTTSLSMGWTFYLLAKHPEIAQKLQAELDRVLQGRLPTLSDLPSLPYTDQICKEVLRLYPSAYFAARQAGEDVELGGYQIKKGSQIFYLPYWVHRDPRFFAEPDRFMPERWTTEFEKSLPKCTYVPFSAGPHICIGNQFAMLEGRLILATVAQQWALELMPGQAPRPMPYITLYPSEPIRMRVRSRSTQ